ncbi:MAG: PHD/YefM family antitoxin component YafN of YafNO toxin-antitoxin module [Arenicella sp.]|jgi:PHD/YefM family antitoxin component YafN of YafNO toxin-antitoxin module
MQKIDYLEVQSKLAKTMRQVCQEDTPITINGAGKDQVVMMPLETFLRLNKPVTDSIDGSVFELLRSN